MRQIALLKGVNMIELMVGGAMVVLGYLISNASRQFLLSEFGLEVSKNPGATLLLLIIAAIVAFGVKEAVVRKSTQEKGYILKACRWILISGIAGLLIVPFILSLVSPLPLKAIFGIEGVSLGTSVGAAGAGTILFRIIASILKR